MQIGLVGLGRMGLGMAHRLLHAGHQVVAYNRTYAKTQDLATEGAEPAQTIADLADKLTPPRAIWIMLPAKVVQSVLDELTGLLEPGDVIIDGGNSPYL